MSVKRNSRDDKHRCKKHSADLRLIRLSILIMQETESKNEREFVGRDFSSGVLVHNGRIFLATILACPLPLSCCPFAA